MNYPDILTGYFEIIKEKFARGAISAEKFSRLNEKLAEWEYKWMGESE